MKKKKLKVFADGSFSSENEFINKELYQTVVKFKNKKGGYKILKTPLIYYSGILPCLFVLLMFTCMTAYCSERLIIKENNHELISSSPDTIIPILIGKGSISNPSEYYGTNMIIKTTTEWEYLKKNFSELYTHIREKEIDFSIYQVIAIIEGGSSSSTIDITNVIEYPDSIVIHISNLIKSITNDSVILFHIVKIPVSKKEIIFKYDDRVERRNKL